MWLKNIPDNAGASHKNVCDRVLQLQKEFLKDTAKLPFLVRIIAPRCLQKSS